MSLPGESDSNPIADEGMVTVGRFESPIEAQMAKGMLESAGVECQLTGENANNLIQSAFGVRLQVLEEDEAAALELLQQPPELDSGDKEPDESVER